MGARPPVDLYRKLRDIKVVVSSDLEQVIGPYDYERVVNAIDGDVNIALPPSVGNRHPVHIKRIDDTDFVVTVTADGTDLIDDSAAVVIVGKYADLILLDSVPGIWYVFGPLISVLPPGGTTGQILGKSSNDDGDVDWVTGSGIAPAGARPTTTNEIIATGTALGFWP